MISLQEPLRHFFLLDVYSSEISALCYRALDFRLEISGSIPAAALSSATLDKLFTHIAQRL